MSENLNTETKIITTDNVQDTSYIPSGIEKKRAVMMYLLVGIIIAISNKKVNVFEYFHLKQSLGWWMSFILVMIGAIAFIFFPGIKYVGLFFLFIMVVFFLIFANQAWKGKYKVDMIKYKLGIFASLGSWVSDLFEISPSVEDIQTENNNTTEPTSVGIDQLITPNEGISEQITNIEQTLKS